MLQLEAFNDHDVSQTLTCMQVIPTWAGLLVELYLVAIYSCIMLAKEFFFASRKRSQKTRAAAKTAPKPDTQPASIQLDSPPRSPVKPANASPDSPMLAGEPRNARVRVMLEIVEA